MPTIGNEPQGQSSRHGGDAEFQRLLAKLPAAAYTCDAEGLITYFNERAVELWGRAPKLNDPVDRFCGSFRLFSSSGTPIPHRMCWMALALRDAKPYTDQEIIIERPDGSQRIVLAYANPFLDEEGRPIGAVNVLVDITDRRRAELARAQLAAIVESSDDAIISKDLNGIIQSWNAAAQRLFGYKAEQAVGRHISFIIPPDRLDEEDRILARLRAGERVYHFDTVRVRSDGQPIHVSLTISPIRDETGRIVGASKTARDITDRKQAEERIYALMTQLKEADRRKDEFLATLAHELRNPLAPLLNMLEIVKRSNDSSKLIQQVRSTLERQLGQLVRLVDDLLDMNRIARGKLDLRKERVDLASVLRQSVETCRPLAQRARHELIVSLPPEPIYLNADSVRLAQVFGNLLSNACKYTEPGGRIWLTVERQDGEAVVRVKDTGLGIPPDKLGCIFDMFAQLDRSLERSQGGLGIGLTLVKRLIDMHGGSVEACSEGQGRGSEFLVRLPILVEAPQAQVPSVVLKEMQATRRRILIVDDNRDAASSLAILLQMTGNETCVAHDGQEGLEAAAKFHPEVVLLDIGLPKLNGYDVCRRIREQPWGKDMVLVALTGWGLEEDRRQSKEAGFDLHMVKPVDFDALKNLLHELQAAKN
ncbi:MAG TPA: PAS domain S-box protein [Gemmataceae bacterium]|nr:PAS domain S-box protein [Gemmataceae bacterium]